MLQLGWAEVKRFHGAAWKHQEAAEFLLRACSPAASSTRAAEAIYLGGYAAECILKALLLSRIRPKRHPLLLREYLTDIRHDLEKLKARLEALRKPVLLPQQEVRHLRLIRRMWSSRMRYDSLPRKTEDAQQFTNAVNQLLAYACGG